MELGILGLGKMGRNLARRLASRQDESYAFKLLVVLRNQFGGHTVKEES